MPALVGFSGLQWASSSATYAIAAPSALLLVRLASTGTWRVPGLLFSDGLVASKLIGYSVCTNHCRCRAARRMVAYATSMYRYLHPNAVAFCFQPPLPCTCT